MESAPGAQDFMQGDDEGDGCEGNGHVIDVRHPRHALLLASYQC